MTFNAFNNPDSAFFIVPAFELCFICSPDYVKGFGGKFGVQTDRVDKSAVGWDHQEKLQLHESQKGKPHTSTG